MKILVCIKQVPESNRVEVDPVTGVLKREGADSKMNPYDLYALETALRMKEQYGGTVTVVTMGPPQAEEVIKEAYCMGADDGVLISDRRFAGSDVLATSYTLFQGIEYVGTFDLILCGKQTTDGDTAQVGPEISEHLNIPSVANVTDIMEIRDNAITLKMDMPSTLEVVRVKFPCLLCVDKNIFQPRLPSYLKKQSTRNKPIITLSLDNFRDKDSKKYGLDGSPTQVQEIFPPEVNNEREVWCGTSDELAERIFNTLSDLKLVRKD